MDKLRYQVDLLTALNQKLSSNLRMYQTICDTSRNAFLYYAFEEDKIETLGNWSYFFDVEIHDIKDISKLYDKVQEAFIFLLRDTMFLEKTGECSASMECCNAQGKIWMEVEVTVNYDGDGLPIDKVIRFRDITKYKRQNDELVYMAYYDELTGLYNRNYFIRLLSDWVRKAEQEYTIISVMFIDIDNFRKINDGLGMITGDEVVQLVGQFLSELKQENVIVSHFNSDLYCIAIYNPVGARSVEHIYRHIKERMKQPFILTDGQELNITVSVGIAEYPEAAGSALELINNAEIVMFKAKHTGKATIQYFNAPILTEFRTNVEIENKLKAALKNKRFMMYYQPQFDTRTNRLRGVEALIRWRDEDGRMISPSQFIPVAEKSGFIVQIGTWVLEESISTFARWRRDYAYPMILSINISAIQYKKQKFVETLIHILEEYGVNPKEVELEITETVLIDDFEEVTEKLHKLREYGIRISLDDFGTGFSSLSYLKGLPIDTLKIDKSFVDTLETDAATKVITESIISMVKQLGYETVAEGVETAEQMTCLLDMDCDNIQGYLLGRPMPASEIEKLLKN